MDEKHNRWGTPPGSDELHNLDFDFEGYFERSQRNELSAAERQDWHARIYGMFCRDVFTCGGDLSKVSFWTAAYVANRLMEGLQGGPWGDVMRLPWDSPTPYFTAKGERAMRIWAAVSDGLRAAPDSNVTDLIAQQAREHNVAYETARADYYALKKTFDWKTGMPRKFLVSPPDSENRNPAEDS
jgi:hypothetical protein